MTEQSDRFLRELAKDFSSCSIDPRCVACDVDSQPTILAIDARRAPSAPIR